MEQINEKDDILFAQLKKAKRRKRRKVILTVLILLLLAGAAIFTTVTILRRRVQTSSQSNLAEVKSYQAESGRISTTVSGSGTISYVDHEDVVVPKGVEIEKVSVAAGDTVKEGATIATVDLNSVMTALADTQTSLESLDKKINDAKNDKVSSTMKTSVSGRVKCIHAQPGENVVDVMTEHGALAILSLDGCMTVAVEAELTPGASVSVLTGGKTYAGTVESCIAGKSVVSLTDNGPLFGAEAEVQDADGAAIGTGTLEIRNPLSITGYAGTVKSISVKENQQVYANSGLFTLTNTQYTANYDTLLRDRNDAEKTLNTLIGLLKTGIVTAPFEGIVTEIIDPDSGSSSSSSSSSNASSASSAASAMASMSSASALMAAAGFSSAASTAAATTSAASTYSGSDTLVAVLAPNKQVCVSVSVDETDILSLEVGQTAKIKVSSISDDEYPGSVTEISKIGVSSSGVTQYTATVTLDKAERMLSGMSASVDIQIQGVDDVVLIPVDALHQTRNMSYVFTSYNEDLKEYGDMVEVVTGMSNSSFVEIVSGLKPGDTVYYTEKANTFNPFAMMTGMGSMGGMGGMNFGNRNSTRTGGSSRTGR